MYAMKRAPLESARIAGSSSSSIRPAGIEGPAARCAYGGVSFEMPRQEGVVRMVITFRTASGAAKPAASVTVTRELLRDGDTLRAHTDRVLARLGRDVGDFDLLESRGLELGGRPARELRFVWMGQHGPTEQTMVLLAPSDDRERYVTILSLVGPRELARETREVWDELLATVRFDALGAAPEPGSDRPASNRSSSAPPAVGGPPLAPPPPPLPRDAEFVPGPSIPMPGYRNR